MTDTIASGTANQAGAIVNPNATIETLLIRGLAIVAFILLHVAPA